MSPQPPHEQPPGAAPIDPSSFTLGVHHKYVLRDDGSYAPNTPRSSFRSITSKRMEELSDDEDEDAKEKWHVRLKRFCLERLFLVLVTIAALIGALLLVAMGINAQKHRAAQERAANGTNLHLVAPLKLEETQTALLRPGGSGQDVSSVVKPNAQFIPTGNALGPPGGPGLREITYCEEQYGLQLYAHPSYCDQFFKCANGTLTLETCENGLLFDGKGSVHNHCDYHWAVDCGSRKAEVKEIRSGTGCLYRFGIFPRSEYCDTSFVRCKFGIREDVPCTKGLAYDDRIHQCNWPDLTPTCDPEEIVNFKCPEKLPSGSFARKFLPYPRFPSDDCYSLIVCVNGYPRRVGCEIGKIFDEVTLSCEHPEDVRGNCRNQHVGPLRHDSP